jgi:CRP-like cAMP-binding protein
MSDITNLLLAALKPEDYSLLRPYFSQVPLAKNAVIQESGAPIEQVYFPLSGMISLLASFQTGGEIEIAAIGYEGAVGAKIESAHPSAPRAIVQLPGSALRMELGHFQQAAQRSVAITRLATSANDIVSANFQQSAGCNALHGVEARLARWLLHARDRFERDDLPLTHEVLSQMLGVRRSTITLAADALQKSGVIRYQRGQIEISDRAGLEARSCECYSALRAGIGAIVESAQCEFSEPNETDAARRPRPVLMSAS